MQGRYKRPAWLALAVCCTAARRQMCSGCLGMKEPSSAGTEACPWPGTLLSHPTHPCNFKCSRLCCPFNVPVLDRHCRPAHALPRAPFTPAPCTTLPPPQEKPPHSSQTPTPYPPPLSGPVPGPSGMWRCRLAGWQLQGSRLLPAPGRGLQPQGVLPDAGARPPGMQQRHECEAGVLADEACFARCARPTAGLPGRGSRPWLLICQLFRMRAHAPIACSASVPLPPPPPPRTIAAGLPVCG